MDTFDLSQPFKVFCLSFNNESIGKISVSSDVFACLRYDFDVARIILRSVFFSPQKRTTKEYIPLKEELDHMSKIFFVKISEQLMSSISSRIRNTILTKKNIMLILEDMNTIYRMLQETTIDAVKTGKTVNPDFKLLGIKQFSRDKSQFRIDYNWTSDKEEDKVDFAYSMPFFLPSFIYCNKECEHHEDCCGKFARINLKGELKCTRIISSYKFYDMFSGIKTDTYSYLCEDAVKFSKQYDDVKFSKENLILFGEYEFSVADSVKESAIKLKTIYNSLVGLQKIEAYGIKQNEYLLKKKHTEALLSIGQMFRALTPDMILEQRGEFAQYISGDSNFAMITLPEEFTAMCLKHFGEIDFAGEKIEYIKGFKEGDKIYLKFGQYRDENREVLVLKDINGEFIVKKHNNKFYAAKYVKNLLSDVLAKEIIVKFNTNNKKELLSAVRTLALANIVKMTANSKDKDALWVDGKLITKIDCPKGKTNYSVLIDKKEGKVKDIILGKTKNKDGKEIDVAFIIFSELTDTQEYVHPNFEEEEYVCPTFE